MRLSYECKLGSVTSQLHLIIHYVVKHIRDHFNLINLNIYNYSTFFAGANLNQSLQLLLLITCIVEVANQSVILINIREQFE